MASTSRKPSSKSGSSVAATTAAAKSATPSGGIVRSGASGTVAPCAEAGVPKRP